MKLLNRTAEQAIRTAETGFATFAGLENSTRQLLFTSASGCRASEKFGISIENYFPHNANSVSD